MEQFSQEMLWGIVENFYFSMRIFEDLYNSYENSLDGLCQQKKVSREALAHLGLAEIDALLDQESFSTLLAHLRELDKICQQFFDTCAPSLFRYYINDIFHELSILQEEFYRLRVDAPEFCDHDEEEYMAILDELNTYLPVKMMHVRTVFKKALEKIELLLSQYKHSKILVRSLYLYGEKVVAPVYRRGLDEFFRRMYHPVYGHFEAYVRAGHSFQQSRFDGLARQAFSRALVIETTLTEDIELNEQLLSMWNTLQTAIGCEPGCRKLERTRKRVFQLNRGML